MGSRSDRDRRAWVAAAVLSFTMFGRGLLGEGFNPRITVTDLGGNDRYLTHITTDKPLYRPGETVRVRGVVLHAMDRTPLPEGSAVQAEVRVRGPKGDSVASGFVASQESVIPFAWTIPAGQPGGEYTLEIHHPHDGYPTAERRFDIRAFRAPRLKTQIRFLRDGYGPGDEVAAILEASRAEGGHPAGAKVTTVARIDGQVVWEGPGTLGADGTLTARFHLPGTIARGEGTLAMVIEDGGVVETASKTIPILLQTVDLVLYPEGGDLVAGVEGRVYVEARTPAGKPADLAGVVTDGAGVEVATFRTEHEGRGRFSITPQPGGAYRLGIREPSGISTTWPLPDAKPTGVALCSTRDAEPSAGPVELKVASPTDRTVTVSLMQRERPVAFRQVRLRAGIETAVPLDPEDGASGVLTATVWGEDGTPLAERLVLRRPSRSLRIEIEPDRKSYVPGDEVRLTVRTRDAAGEPAAAWVGIAVTDDSVLEMVETREQAPRLPAMALLEGEVRELYDAGAYLDPTSDRAATATDLLLGTQGWRRFALVDVEEFLERHEDAGRRALAVREPPVQVFPAAPGGLGRGGPVDLDGGMVDREGAMVQKGARPEANRFIEAVPVPVPMAAAPGADEGRLAEEAAPPLDGPAAVPLRPEDDLAAEPPMAQPVMGVALRPPPAPVLADQRRRERRIARGVAGKADALEKEMQIRNDFVVVREFSHTNRPGRRSGDRVDFVESLYWNVGLRTDSATGEARVRFTLNDSVTGFRVRVDGFDQGGGLGEGSHLIESKEPFYLEPKTPLVVSEGDQIQLPVVVVNGTADPVTAARLTVQPAAGLELPRTMSRDLPADSRTRWILPLTVLPGARRTPLVLEAEAGPHRDRVTREIEIRPRGFPETFARGGMVGPATPARHEIAMPDRLVAGSLEAAVRIYPSPMGRLTRALERLIQEPYGCFEQTSSTAYPLVMAQQYFKSHTDVDPRLVERSEEILGRSYQRLLGFECKSGGFEWFGEDPGHEALTAFGLMEFADMGRVRPVDDAMVTRTRTWLVGQRDGQGGFKRERRALHTWIADSDTSNGYILWTLLESGEKGLDREVEALAKVAAESKDSYVLALAANVLALAGRDPEARELSDRLVRQQTPEGWIDGASTSIVGSRGDGLVIETTALGALAWLKKPQDYQGPIAGALKHLARSCEDGRMGSTQATVLALRSIVTHDAQNARPREAGRVRVLIDGQAVSGWTDFDSTVQGVIDLPDISSHLKPGPHQLVLEMEKGNEMPYTISVRYHTDQPVSSADCRVGLEVELVDGEITEGAPTEMMVTVWNRHHEAIPTPVAIIGVPGGLEVRHDQLKELVKQGRIAAWEVVGADVVLYWRSMEPDQKVRIPLSLVAVVPGTYTGAASRAYEYYTDAARTWVAGPTVEIAPRSGE